MKSCTHETYIAQTHCNVTWPRGPSCTCASYEQLPRRPQSQGTGITRQMMNSFLFPFIPFVDNLPTHKRSLLPIFTLSVQLVFFSYLLSSSHHHHTYNGLLLSSFITTSYDMFPIRIFLEFFFLRPFAFFVGVGDDEYYSLSSQRTALPRDKSTSSVRMWVLCQCGRRGSLREK